jgi:hypothetical protein
LNFNNIFNKLFDNYFLSRAPPGRGATKPENRRRKLQILLLNYGEILKDTGRLATLCRP